MSRTYKDKKWALRYPENEYHFGVERVAYELQCRYWYTGETIEGSWTSYWLRDLPGVKTKKPRHEYGHWNWYQSTPSWWTRIRMTKPKRRACKVWERQVLQQDIEEADCPDYGKRPHIYFY